MPDAISTPMFREAYEHVGASDRGGHEKHEVRKGESCALLVIPFMFFMSFMVEAVCCLVFPAALREMRSDVLAAGVPFERLVGAALGIIVAKLPALVVRCAPLGKAEFHLGVAAAEVDPQRHERASSLLELSGQLADFLAVQEKLSVAEWVDVVSGALVVRRDVHATKQRLAATQHGVAFLNRAAAGTEALHFSPCENESRFNPVEDFILVTGLAIGRDDMGHGPHRLAESQARSKENLLAKAHGENTKSAAVTMKDMKSTKEHETRGFDSTLHDVDAVHGLSLDALCGLATNWLWVALSSVSWFELRPVGVLCALRVSARGYWFSPS